VHVVTATAKAILERFYGQRQAYAYFDGCSDGGREGMMEAERFPADFNGIIAGASVVNETANNTIFHAWAAQHLTHADGSPVMSNAVITLLHRAATDACDTTGDGVKDELIGDPSKCRFDPGVLECRAGAAPDTCLTAEQVAAVRSVYSGPTDAKGQPLYFGYPIGSELSWIRQAGGGSAPSNGPSGGFVAFLASDPANPEANNQAVGFTPGALTRQNVFGADLNALNPDLRPFAKAGGKLIMWHGWADVAVPSMSSVTFYGEIKRVVGPAEIERFVRLYMLPGVYHCGGGLGPDKIDAMSAIVAWTEDGVAPGAITATKKDGDQVISHVIQPYGK
jgi:hypothetical protein